MTLNWPSVMTAIVTPFNIASVDYESLGDLIQIQLNSGCGIVLFGTTGECVTLSLDEKNRMMNFVIDEFDKNLDKFIIGIGGNNTLECIEFYKIALSLGFKRFMATTPYYNKPTQDGLFYHFCEIDKMMNDDTELILYNVPGRTGVNLLPETILKISRHSKQIIGIKEASGNLSQMISIRELLPNFSLYCGDDGLIIPAMSIGAKGLISVISNIYPKEFCEIVELANKPDMLPIAFSLFLQYNKLIQLLFTETSPSPVKSALKMKKNILSDEVRLPLVSTSIELKNKIQGELIYAKYN